MSSTSACGPLLRAEVSKSNLDSHRRSPVITAIVWGEMPANPDPALKFGSSFARTSETCARRPDLLVAVVWSNAQRTGGRRCASMNRRITTMPRRSGCRATSPPGPSNPADLLWMPLDVVGQDVMDVAPRVVHIHEVEPVDALPRTPLGHRCPGVKLAHKAIKRVKRRVGRQASTTSSIARWSAIS